MPGVTRVGATKQYSDNWDNIFGGKGRPSKAKAASKPARKSTKTKKSAKRGTKKPAKKGGKSRR